MNILKTILKFIDKIFAEILIILIKIYQYTLSPDKGLPSLRLKGKVCAHEPHCSKYSILSLKRYGFLSGLPKVVDRVFSCVGSKHKIYDPHKYNIVFFSSAPIGIPFLQKLNASKRFDIKGIVTMPDKPSDRGMKVKPNIIKSEGENIFGDLIDGPECSQKYLKNISKIIFLHGKDKTSKDVWYPRFKESMEEIGITCHIPDLPNTKEPILSERLEEIDKLNPDENTILIGHSRGGVAVLRRLEEKNQKIKKTILIAANDGKSKYMLKGEKNNNFYSKEGYDFEKIKSLCPEFSIFHSKNDPRVKYEYGLNNAKGLDAKLYSFEDKGHFGYEIEGYNYHSNVFPELVNEIQFNDPYHTLIQTPNSLRLDSKKYAEEAHNFKLRLEAKKPDYLVVIAYGKIIPQYILDIPKIAPINVHGSLLPKYRGASPLQSIFLNQDETTGITIMKMDAGMDTGDMIDKLKFKLNFHRTVKDLIDELMKRGPKFLNKTLISYGKKLLGEVKQNEKQTSYCQKIVKEDGLIDPFKDTLQDIYRQYRAYALRPKIYFYLPPKQNKENKHQTPPLRGEDTGGVKQKRIIIEKIILNEKLFSENKNKPLLDGKKLNPCVQDIAIKPEGKKTMTREAFKTGYLK